MPVLFVEIVQILQLMCEVEQNTSFSNSRLGMPEVCVIYSVYCLIEIMHGCIIYNTLMYKVNNRWSIFYLNSKPMLWFLSGGERVTTLTPPPPHLHQTISLLNIIEFNWVIVANGTYKAAWEGMWCILGCFSKDTLKKNKMSTPPHNWGVEEISQKRIVHRNGFLG